MVRGKKLFQKDSLSGELSGRRDAFCKEVAKISDAQFNASSYEQVVAHVFARAYLEPIALNEDSASIHFEDMHVDISKDPRRTFFERPHGPVYAAGRCAIVSIPYSGEEWLFEYKTNPHYPYAELYGETTNSMFEGDESVVRIFVPAANDERQDDFLQMIEEKRKILRGFVQTSRGQVKGFNDNLEPLIGAEVKARRERMSQHHSIAAKLNIPLQRRPTAPPIEPVKIAPRHIPQLLTAKGNSTREYGISDGEYDLILHFIRHQGRTYETTPDTYAVHDEEGLRDIILGQFKRALSRKRDW